MCNPPDKAHFSLDTIVLFYSHSWIAIDRTHIYTNMTITTYTYIHSITYVFVSMRIKAKYYTILYNTIQYIHYTYMDHDEYNHQLRDSIGFFIE